MKDNLTDLTDATLMTAYIKGHHRAFDVLYTRHKGGLYGYFLHQVSSPEIAQELYQDCWLKVIKNRHQYKPKAQFNTWLYTLAHHHLVDWYRKNQHRQKITTDDAMVETMSASILEMPENEFQQQQMKKALNQAIKSLPLDQRNIFLLHQQAHLSVVQIAQLIGEKKETVKSRYRYAINKLRRALEGLK